MQNRPAIYTTFSPFSLCLYSSSSRLRYVSLPSFPILLIENPSFYRFFISRKEREKQRRNTNRKRHDDSLDRLTDCFLQDLWCLHPPWKERGRNGNRIRRGRFEKTDVPHRGTEVFCVDRRMSSLFEDDFRHFSVTIARLRTRVLSMPIANMIVSHSVLHCAIYSAKIIEFFKLNYI